MGNFQDLTNQISGTLKAKEYLGNSKWLCECLKCGKRFTTYETVESLPMIVVKKDNSRQAFDRNKILNGMVRACEKRPVSMADMERVADEIEQIVQNSLDREVSTVHIGELVMERLKPLDEVAYVRFASVYRQFKDINSFMHELNKILQEKYYIY